jgi:hypothetical protein
MQTDTPLYDQLVVESPWHPGELRPPFDLYEVIAYSYERTRFAALGKVRDVMQAEVESGRKRDALGRFTS